MEGPVGYARHISNVDSAREGDLRVPKPERPPSRSHPVGHGTCVTSSMCNTIDFCLYASVFNNGTLCRRCSSRHTILTVSLYQYRLTPTLLPTTQDRARIASASVLHRIDYQPWSWGLSGQLCRRVETTWAAGIGVIFKNPAV